jgi:photosystem II stability/assembly factor-like uncharacterized protein
MLGMARGGRGSKVREGAAAVLAALVGLALPSACGSGSGALGKDAGNVSASDWTMVVHPVSDVYMAVWLDAPDTIYAVARDDPSEDNGTSYSVASSHDDGKTWTTVPLTDSSSPLLSIAAVGPTDVYAVGFTYDYTDLIDSPPVVAKSTDRGATFTLLHPSFAGGFFAVAADGAGNPIGVGYDSGGGFFLRSTDGGATWSRTRVPGTEALYALWTTASGTIYACGQAASASASPDGGADAGRPDAGSNAGSDAGSDGGGDGGAGAGPGGVVVRSDDGGNTWTTLTTAPAPLLALSGTSDGQRIIAVGAGYTEIESTDAGATWYVHCGSDDDTGDQYSGFSGVWVPDAQSAPFIAAGNAPYVVRGVSSTNGGPGPEANESSEELPLAGLGLQSGAVAVAGNATEVWAVGAGVFRRM